MSHLTPEACATMIRQTERVIALTGAGVSTAAGIPDFRGPQGLYVTRQYDPETIFDIEYFRKDPRPFFEFSRDFLRMTRSVRPTFTHEFLARLEHDGRLRAIITQNIDPLHEMAGSSNILPVHGNYWTSRCLACGAACDYETMLQKIESETVPSCACGGVLKPNVVFFGEDVMYMDRAYELAAAADLLLVLGSSLVVYPAALLPQVTTGRVVVVNRGEVILAPAPNRFFVDEELDVFLRAVADKL